MAIHKQPVELKLPFERIAGKTCQCEIKGCEFEFGDPEEAYTHYRIAHGLRDIHDGKATAHCQHDHQGCKYKEKKMMAPGSRMRHYLLASGICEIFCKYCKGWWVWRNDRTHLCHGNVPDDIRAMFAVPPKEARAKNKEAKRRGGRTI